MPRTSSTRPPSKHKFVRQPASDGLPNPGWGGEAKGEGVHVGPGTQIGAAYHALPPVEKAARKAHDEELERVLSANLVRLATQSEHDMAQIAATKAWMERRFGMPVARNYNVNANELSDLDEDALNQRLVDLEARTGRLTDGTATPSD